MITSGIRTQLALPLLFAVFILGTPASTNAQTDSVPAPVASFLRALDEATRPSRSSGLSEKPIRVYGFAGGSESEKRTVAREQTLALFRAIPLASQRVGLARTKADDFLRGCTVPTDVTTCTATDDFFVATQPEMLLFRQDVQVVVRMFRATRGAKPEHAGTYFGSLRRQADGEWVLMPGTLMVLAH